MIKHTWASRLAPPLLLAIIVACVWYGAANVPQPSTAAPSGQATVSAEAPNPSAAQPQQHASQQPIADVAPIVNKLGNDVRFSVDTKPFKQVQKVEYYVEDKMVGAAFTTPYTVTISQNTLTAGTHTVTAKVYAGATTAQTTPALFTATPKQAVQPNKDDSEQAPAKPTPTPPAPATGLSRPTNLAGHAGTDNVSAVLTWSATPDATSYQVWRDGSQLTVVTGTTYTDTGLTPGQTYDYSVVAASATATSDPSSQVAVTMPAPALPPDPGTGSGDDGGTTTPSDGTTPPTDPTQSTTPGSSGPGDPSLDSDL